VNIEIIEGKNTSFNEVEDLWLRSAPDRQDVAPFLRPRWTSGVHEGCLEAGTPVHVIGRSDGKLLAYAGLKRTKAKLSGVPFTTYTWLGERMCDYHDVICPDSSQLKSFFALMLRRLSNSLWPVVVLLPHVPGSSPSIHAFGEAATDLQGWSNITEGEAIVRVDLRNELNQRLRSRFKYVDWCERRLGKDGHAVTFFACEPRSAEFRSTFTEFIELHERRMTEKGNQSPYNYSGVREMVLGYGEPPNGEIVLELTGLRVAGEMIAGHIGFRTKTTYFYLHPAFDDKFKAVSPGQMLLAHLIKHAFSQQVQCLDLLRGLESYKMQWGDVETGNARLIFVPGLLNGLIAKRLFLSGGRVNSQNGSE
jgi:CelD/BcsL family acetyltransferase involved in cellulose biosynthesis